jgi:hypothetical protein
VLVVRARVNGGRIIVDESTDLPEGTQVNLAIFDEDAAMSDSECLKLDATIGQGHAATVVGKGIEAEACLRGMKTDASTDPEEDGLG